MLNFNRRYLYAAALVVLLLAFAGGMKYANLRNQEQVKTENIVNQAAGQDAQENTKTDFLQIYVTGEVEKPGVYQLPPDARVYQAIEMARSLPTANLKNINLAQKLEDGQAIVVPAAGEESSPGSIGGDTVSITAPAGVGGSGKVNINTASVQELDEKLPGIGPTLAQRIVDYRKLHGSFARVEDLNNVSGIGDKKYAEIKDLIVVR